MIPSNPNSVYVTNSEAAADVMAAYLQQHGFDARVVSNVSLGGVPELILWSKVETASGAYEVWVGDEAIGPSRILVERFEVDRLAALDDRIQRGEVAACCESCGAESQWPGRRRGGVVRCPRCQHYLDIPD